MEQPIIEVKNVSKQYHIGSREPYLVLRDALARLYKMPLAFLKNGGRGLRKNTFSALAGVSFDVHPGEVVGIIGRNGAGKTTLLKILSRITYPTNGEIILRGRIASLLEVGTGFHPELTGRENVYFNGAILGMRKKEIDDKFDEIVSFAEVEQFMDTPVKHYSSGMQLRLAFSVAAHLEPEILLVDEVLAVGDAQFQKKCLGKMSEVARAGRTVLFVSHNMEAVERLCSRVILLKDGIIVRDGPVAQVIQDYLKVGVEEAGERIWATPEEAPGDDVVRMHAIRIKDKTGCVSTNFDVRDAVTIEQEYWVLKEGYSLTTFLTLSHFKGYDILHSYDNIYDVSFEMKRSVGLYRSVCMIPGDFLNDGQVTIHVGVVSLPRPQRIRLNDILRFNVHDAMDSQGARGNMPWPWLVSAVRPRLKWEVEKKG
ncbi:MAG: polysaccharide ABC transporter ATP-binding protein [bacterium]|nr:polysaccharide ABC transporter ATP-binding protein [bacterium]